VTPPTPPQVPGRQYGPRLPPYVERGGEVVFAQPYEVNGPRMYAFTLRANPDLLDKMLHRELSAPTGGAEKFSAAGSVVLLTFVDIPAISSTDAADSWLGCSPEKEMAIWVPVIDHHRGNSLLWSVPYIFVDSSIAMVGGREPAFRRCDGALEYEMLC
jgi:hypothetical protein